MLRSVFTNFTHAGSGFPGGAARRAVTRAASLAAITVLMLGTLSGKAVAQATDTPLRAYFTKLTCLEQSDDNTWPNPDHDEPYLVIYAADLRGSLGSGKAITSQIFSDVDKGEDRYDSLLIWPLFSISSSPIGSDDDYIFLAALMESDDYRNASAVHDKVYQTLEPKLRVYKAAGVSRAKMVSDLRADMDLAIEASRGGDDRIGPVFEILWGTEWLPVARSGQTVTRSAILLGSDSKYSLEFQLRR